MARILIADPDGESSARFAGALERAGHVVEQTVSSAGAIERLDADHYDLAIVELGLRGQGSSDLVASLSSRVPDLALVVVAAEAAVTEAVSALRAGAADFVLKPSNDEEIVYVANKAIAGASRSNGPPAWPRSMGLLGETDAMQNLRSAIGKAAVGDSTALLRGESGTGKELVARALHEQSARRSGPFVKIDCGSLPDGLLDSEMFGHEKGAFTGATMRKPGRIELASGGTLFLDEVGELSASMQVKFLRLLQDREFERLGGRQTLRIDARFVLATHRDLEAMVANGAFRQDLFYRINVLALWLPPLRSRRDDVPLLAREFCARFAASKHKRVELGAGAVRVLRAQRWPGNVRQLENFVERLVVFSDGSTIEESDVERELVQKPRFTTQAVDTSIARDPTVSSEAAAMSDAVRLAERSALAEALGRCGWDNKAGAARVLGISRSTLYNKIRELGLQPPKSSS